MSKSFVKLVDYAVFPALLMLLGKFGGIAIISGLLGYNLKFSQYANSVLSLNGIVPKEDLIKITVFSDLIAYLVIAVIVLVAVVRALYFHDSHIKPRLSAKLVQNNMMGLIRNSYSIYYSAIVSLTFLWIMTFIIIINWLINKEYILTLLFSVVISTTLTLIIYVDIRREIDNIKMKPSLYNWD
ncbi:hypothetical protein KC678_00650 [Candidatus Dojkabacteria bacterium]|uniref:Uncharacterized protein n=1 Tax=Candidatus Dojkabacteria bacterium TaxID=2099670 RepID=A0A955I9Y9_9BACT|nr:hypothetical protein [Candidatus Dojkabacteria bacterium]